MTRGSRIRVLALAGAAALVAAAGASAHAIVSPPVAQNGKLQQFTLSVPTEKEGATTTTIELTVPAGFAIDSFEPSPGWTRHAQAATVTWSGGHTPTDEDSVFRFNASTNGTKTYTFDVRQTYSDGSVVDWSGPESSDTAGADGRGRVVTRRRRLVDARHRRTRARRDCARGRGRRARRARRREARRMIRVRLIAAVLALSAGAAAVVVAYLLLHGTPGPA